MIEQTIISPDGHQIQTFIWPNDEAKAWVHIFHGMSEHALRYNGFAEKLVASGFAVVAHNHRGHGTSKSTILGSYANSHGWQKVLQDISIVRDDICNKELPYFIFAHSMGSFIAQSFLSKQPAAIGAVVLSGSNYQAVWLSRIGRVIAKIESVRLGKEKSSALLQFLSFGNFNQKFKPNRTEYDWLSRDGSKVDKYINDPLCGFPCSTGLWLDFFEGLIDVFTPSSIKKIQTNLPILILGGSQDPVGLMGTGLPKLLKAYEVTGQKNLTLKLYEGARHETLNETNRQEVSQDVITWFEKQI